MDIIVDGVAHINGCNFWFTILLRIVCITLYILIQRVAEKSVAHSYGHGGEQIQ